jgi:hypothetical protein
MDIPILLGRIRTLVWVNLADTAMTIALLAGFCLWGLEAAAQSRIAIGAVWFVIYAIFVGRLLRIDPASLASIYLRSATCAASAASPLLLAHYQGWVRPDMGFLPLLGLCLAGAGLWFFTLPLVRHPLWREVLLGFAQLPRGRSARNSG